MLTDYERYQLEWMIEHGHSLDELMAELTYYQNDLEATRGVNLTVSEVFDAWTSDRGFVSLENDVITKNMIRAGIEHGVIRSHRQKRRRDSRFRCHGHPRHPR